MKKILSITALVAFFFAILIGSCKKENSNPFISGQGVESYDLIQVTNSTAYVPVVLGFSDNKSIDSVTIAIYPNGQSDTQAVARNSVTNITHKDAISATVQVPFPVDTTAPSGLYVVSIKLYSGGKVTLKQYTINILNFHTPGGASCNFPAVALTGTQNVVFYVTCPANTNGEDVWISGDFEKPNQWTGGGSQTNYKLTKISNTCYYIALNMPAGSQYKFTRGSWSQVEKAGDGNDWPNGVSSTDGITWNGGNRQFTTVSTPVNIKVSNWADRVVTVSTAKPYPDNLVKTGYATIAITLPSNSPANGTTLVNKYYLVKKGGNLNDKSIPLTQYDAALKNVGALVPKDVTTTYYVVKDTSSSIATNAFGVQQAVTFDGVNNPVKIVVGSWSDLGNFTPIPTSLTIVGDATTFGWANPSSPDPGAVFTNKGNNVFELSSVNLTAGKGYLLLPVAGKWDHKFGGNDKLGGTIIAEGPNIPAPSVTGNYKIVVDFNTASYTLTKL